VALPTYTTAAVAHGKPLRTGKVRDLYEIDGNLLLVASDRVSAFDVVMAEPVPGKGVVLTALTEHWLVKTADLVRNHRITVRVDEIKGLTDADRARLRGRAMLCRRAAPYPFEFVVRGYLSGSGWAEYQQSGSVCGVELPKGLLESSRLPDPILTPTTKAERGHDEPVSFDVLERDLGAERARQLRDLALAVYSRAASIASDAGILIADTKFEFGEIDRAPALIDEVLTPDSSRFWPAGDYKPGRGQPSYDKQFLRDYLTSTGWNRTPPPPPVPAEVVSRTVAKYSEICQRLTGETPERFAARV
jgi:phosphoribosylaminoimidazole-succinocarboxamide synthase